MSAELKIDVNTGFTNEQDVEHIIVLGYVKNFGPEGYGFSASSVKHSLVDPDGKPVPNLNSETQHNIYDMLLIQPQSKYEFESQLIVQAPIRVGGVYQLTATLADDSDSDTSLFPFRQFYLGAKPRPTGLAAK